jgi:hypothetical protein
MIKKILTPAPVYKIDEYLKKKQGHDVLRLPP